jgi:hypothetical protein
MEKSFDKELEGVGASLSKRRGAGAGNGNLNRIYANIYVIEL